MFFFVFLYITMLLFLWLVNGTNLEKRNSIMKYGEKTKKAPGSFQYPLIFLNGQYGYYFCVIQYNIIKNLYAQNEKVSTKNIVTYRITV